MAMDGRDGRPSLTHGDRARFTMPGAPVRRTLILLFVAAASLAASASSTTGVTDGPATSGVSGPMFSSYKWKTFSRCEAGAPASGGSGRPTSSITHAT